jgi:hypothetical protein
MVRSLVNCLANDWQRTMVMVERLVEVVGMATDEVDYWLLHS